MDTVSPNRQTHRTALSSKPARDHALQKLRSRRASGGQVAHGAQVLSSPDGALTFEVRRAGNKLFVQRRQIRANGTIAMQFFLVDDAVDFARWCDVEPTRFEHPLVFDRLRRYGDEVLGGSR